jgi:serine/threonine-protein kinase
MAAEDLFGIVGTTQAGNFHIEKVVAQGGFGVVYRAHHGGFRAPVAIKCLKIPDAMSKQERDVFLEKFREEAELTFRLSAAIGEVCRPLHVDVLMLADGRFVPFLAMEWLEGESLDAIVTRRREQGLPPLGLHKVVKMMRPVAVALAKAHRFPGPEGAVAIIHRDLKPENLMIASIGGSDAMKILDFGIAKAKRAASQAAGRVTGRRIAEDEASSFTPAYGAPEQWAPKSWGETGPWTDVWGLALCMGEALCGKPPIDGEPWVMRRVCLDEKRRPTPRNNGADVPAEVDKVFEQALAVDPRKRFKTIEAFWSEVERSMGLTPTLGPRDDRREPGDGGAAARQEEVVASAPGARDSAVSSSKKRLEGAGAAPQGERLARIELQKVSLPAQAAAKDRPQPKPAPAPDPIGSSGTWEFDLGLPDTGAQATEARSVPNGEGFAPKAPLTAVAQASGQAPARKPPMELELPLLSGDEPFLPSIPSPLEMSLPIVDGSAPLTALEAQAPLPSPATVSAPTSPAKASPSSSATSGEFLLMEAEPRPREEAQVPTSSRSADSALAIDRSPTDSASTGSIALASTAPKLAGGSAPPRQHRSPASARAGALGHRPPLRSRMVNDLKERLRTPVGILVAALLVAGADTFWYRVTGDHVSLGPVRLFWIAAPLALFGVGFTLWRLMEGHDDG